MSSAADVIKAGLQPLEVCDYGAARAHPLYCDVCGTLVRLQDPPQITCYSDRISEDIVCPSCLEEWVEEESER